MATTAGLRSSSSAFPRRTPSIDCDKVRRTPRSVGSAARVPRKGWALISSAVSRRTSSTERKRTPFLAKNSPPSGRLTVRITSERGERSFTSASAASSAASGVVAVDDGDDEVGRLGECLIEHDLLLAPGKRARQELLAIGRDGEVAREIAGGKDRCEQEAEDDEPRMAARQAHGPRDGFDRHGIAVLAHGIAVKRL